MRTGGDVRGRGDEQGCYVLSEIAWREIGDGKWRQKRKEEKKDLQSPRHNCRFTSGGRIYAIFDYFSFSSLITIDTLYK